MRRSRVVLWLAATCSLYAASTGGLRFETAGSLTSNESEVISGSRSIKGSYTGSNSYTPYLRSDPATLPLRRGETYQITFRYKILETPDRGFEVLFLSPTGGSQNQWLPSQTIRGNAGSSGAAMLTNTLGPFDDYQARWNVIGKGAIAIDDIQIRNMTRGGEVVAAEDAEPGTLLRSTFFVSANKPSFVWGEAVKVTATLRDEAGQSRSPGPITWTVNPPTAAAIQPDGAVTPRALQTFVVRGTAGGISGDVRMQARPKRIVVAPERPLMAVGTTQRMRADALDVNDRVIPDARVEWAVSSQFYSGTPSATIDQAGMLKAVTQARVRVVARIRYADALPGFGAQAQGEALVDIKAPTTYRFERVFVAKPNGASSSILAPRPAPLIPTETGGFMFAASLDGLGGALLEWSGGAVKPVLASGRVHVQSGLPLTDILSYTRTVSGEVLTREVDASGGNLISRGPARLITPLFTDNSSLFGADSTWGYTISRNSLADSGAMLVVVGYRDSVTEKNAQGLFRGGQRSLSEAVITTIDERLDPAEVPTGFPAFGIANDGTAWFVGCCNRPGALWRSRPGSAPEKILSVGARVGDEIFRATYDNYTGAPTLFVSPNGDAIVAAITDRGTRWWLWHNGDTTPSETLNVGSAFGLFWYDPALGALLDTSLPGRGRGLHLWNKEGAKVLLALNDTSLDGSPVEEILSACTSSGTIYVMVRTSDNPMLIARLTPNPEVLLKAGDSVPVSVPPVISALIPGARMGTPLVLAGGQTGSIARLDDSGGVTPVVRLGNRLPDKKYFVGSKLSQVRTLADGRIVFGQDLFAFESGVYTWNNGTIELTVPAPLTDPSGKRMGYVNSLEVNRQGDVLFLTGFAGSGIFRVRDGRTTHVGTTPLVVDGVELSGFPNSLAIDGTGRASFSTTKDGVGPYQVLWDGAESHIILSPDSKTTDGRIISGVGASRGCGDGLIMGALGTYLQFRTGGWQYLADRSEPVASGEPANSLSNFTMDVNNTCDVAFRGGNPGGQGSGHIGTRFKSKYHEVQDLDELTPQGDLLRVVQLLINDDGTLYVLAGNDRGEEVIYRGTPLQ